jgi:hypothetical protein
VSMERCFSRIAPLLEASLSLSSFSISSPLTFFFSRAARISMAFVFIPLGA